MDKIVKHAKDIKAEKIQVLGEKISRAKTIIFADYRGLTADQIANLRDKIKESGGEMIVTKNTLLQKALGKNKLNVTVDDLQGPTATVFAYEDEIAPVSVLAQSAKTTELPKFKFGFFEMEQVSADKIEQLAKLPGKDVLRAKVVGALSSPVYGIVSVLAANLRNLVFALDQIKIQKETS